MTTTTTTTTTEDFLRTHFSEQERREMDLTTDKVSSMRHQESLSDYSGERVPPVVHHTPIKPWQSLSSKTRLLISRATTGHESLKINDELTLYITNSVHCTQLQDAKTKRPYRLPLNEFARLMQDLGVQYTTQRFAKLVVRFAPPMRETFLVFATGMLVEAGRLSFAAKEAQLHALLDMIRVQGHPNVEIGRRECTNIVSTGMVGFRIRLTLLKLRYDKDDYVFYEPDTFPGAIIRHPKLKDLLSTTQGETDDASLDAVDDAVDLDDMDIDDMNTAPESGVRYGNNGGIDDMEIDDDARPVASNVKETFNHPDAIKAAYAYAQRKLKREQFVTGGVGNGTDQSEEQRLGEIMEAYMSHQGKKNIVALAFSPGVLICGGTKNLHMLVKASKILFEMIKNCRDTAANRWLETTLLRERNLPIPNELYEEFRTELDATGYIHPVYPHGGALKIDYHGSRGRGRGRGRPRGSRGRAVVLPHSVHFGTTNRGNARSRGRPRGRSGMGLGNTRH